MAQPGRKKAQFTLEQDPQSVNFNALNTGSSLWVTGQGLLRSVPQEWRNSVRLAVICCQLVRL